MVGVYLSGTGNTKHCMELFCRSLDANVKLIPIEDAQVVEVIKTDDKIVIGYPTQYSNAPYMVRAACRKSSSICWAFCCF